MQARPSIFQAGNFTGWGSEGIKILHVPQCDLETTSLKDCKVVDPSADRVLVVKAKAGDSRASAIVFD